MTIGGDAAHGLPSHLHGSTKHYLNDVKRVESLHFYGSHLKKFFSLAVARIVREYLISRAQFSTFSALLEKLLEKEEEEATGHLSDEKGSQLGPSRVIKIVAQSFALDEK